MIDVHAHLDAFEDVKDVIEEAKKHGVEKIITAGYNLLSSKRSMEIANEFDGVYAVVGVHPENVEEVDKNYLEEIERFALDKKVVGIGEIGLDYHFTTETKEKQKKMFIDQIELANNLGLPIVVHSRDAMGDTLEILKTHTPKFGGLMHCYSGSIESAKELLKLNFSFSFGGVCTFKNAKNVCAVIENLPLEKIMLETDCPYLAPVPHRGERNEPKYIPLIAEKIAELKNVSLEEVVNETTENVEKLFNLRWWDYSKEKFNINGRVCLKNSIAFGILGVLVVKFITPFLLIFLFKF